MSMPSTKKSKKWRRKKELQFLHQRGLCCWCLKPMEEDATWEHVMPISLGGPLYKRANLVLAHARCNNKRGNKIMNPHFKPFPRNWRGAAAL